MSRYPRLTAKDMKGIVAIMPTPVKKGADHWRSRDVVNLDEAAQGVDRLIRDGIDILLVNGTFGEASTLMWEELKKFSATVMDTANGRIPVFLGATTLNTRDTIERGLYFRDLGAHGLFLGRPMWCQMSEAMIVEFYRNVAEALPEMNILIYDNPEAFKGKVSTRTYEELAKIPQVVASKYRSVLAGVASDTLVSDLRAVKGNIKLLPHDCDWYYGARWFPEEIDRCWSSGVSAGPAPVAALKKAIHAKDWEKAKRITDDISWAYEHFMPQGSFVAFHVYNIAIQKARFDAAGYIKAGPALPPYHVIPADTLETSKECGRRWKQLQEKYSKGG